MTVPKQSPDLIDVIVADHREIERVFTELEQGTIAPEQRKELVDHVIIELVRHAVAEEQHMYPATREMLPDGDQIADRELQDHAEAERVMKDLEGVEPTDPRFEELLRSLMSIIRDHIQDEETNLLPRLREACSKQQLQELGDKIVSAKRSAPTRPHPTAPDKPPANRLLDAGAGMIDRMRDALTGRS